MPSTRGINEVTAVRADSGFFMRRAAMATWSTLKEYVRSHYKISDEQPDSVRLIFDVGDLRSQVVFLWRMSLLDGQEDWVQIESPFGRLESVDLRGAIDSMGKVVCGGIAAMGELVTVRHSVPLLNLDINEFERPLILVTNTADRLERQFQGGDQF
jgi:hypothetical protein